MVRVCVFGLVLGGALLVSGCGTFSDSLRRDFAASHYDDVMERAHAWLQRHPLPVDPEEMREQEQVQRLLAEAEVERAWTRGDADELARLRSSFAGQVARADLRARAFQSEATLRFNDEVLSAKDPSLVRQFRADFEGTAEADAARTVEVRLAAEAARRQATVQAEQSFRRAYSDWAESRDALSESRRREVALAASGGTATVASEQRFRATYGDWPEASAAIGKSRSHELMLAFEAARSGGASSGLRVFRATYAEWVEGKGLLEAARRDEGMLALHEAHGDLVALTVVHRDYPGTPAGRDAGVLAAAVLLGPLETTRAVDVGAMLLGLEQHGLVSQGREWAASRDAAVREAAERGKGSAGYRLYRLLRPDSPFAAEAARREADAAWAEAVAADTEEAFFGFARRYGEHPRAEEAERRAVVLQRLGRADDEKLRPKVTSRRVLPSGEVELTLDVWRCGGRVAGLRQPNFELFVGSKSQPITSFAALEDDRPLAVAFALDLSGSMAVEREAMRTAIRHFAETFRFRGRNTTVGLVTFSDEVGPKLAPTPDANAFASFLRNIPSPHGGAAEDSTAALLAATEMLKSAPGEKVVILLTDEGLQLNVGGQRALARPMKACAPVLRRLSEFKACQTPACRLQAFAAVSPRNNLLAGLCARAAGARRCAAGLDETAFADALQACGGSGGVDAGSRALAQLRDALLKSGVRLHLVLPHGLGHGDAFEELATSLGGRIHEVDDDSVDPATYIAPLLDIADQVSKQYVVRYRPGKEEASLPARVLVRPEQAWTSWALLDGEVAELVGQPGSTPACPELTARSRDGRLWRSTECGRRFTPWATALPGKVERLLPSLQGGTWLLSGGTLLHATADGATTAAATGLRELEAVGLGVDARLWVLGRDEAGLPAVRRELAEGFEGVDFGVLPAPASVLFPADASGRACLVLVDGARRCRDASGGLEATSATAALPGRLPRKPTVAQVLDVVPGPALFVTGAGAVFRTLDGAGTGHEVLPPANPGWVVAHVGRLVCAVSGEQTQCSEDAGLSWFAVSSGQGTSGGLATVGAAGGQLFLGRGTAVDQLAWVVNREVPSSAVYFETDKAAPTGAMRPFLVQLGHTLATNPALRLRVEGHADSRGADSHNEDLSRRRAEAVAAGVLKAGGQAAQVSAVGFGSRRPVRVGGSPEVLSRNRRVELLLLEPLVSSTDEAGACPAETKPSAREPAPEQLEGDGFVPEEVDEAAAE